MSPKAYTLFAFERKKQCTLRQGTAEEVWSIALGPLNKGRGYLAKQQKRHVQTYVESMQHPIHMHKKPTYPT
jgi:hypothetical protein